MNVIAGIAQTCPGRFSAHLDAFEGLRAQYRGRPVIEVRAAVLREWVMAEGTVLPESELTALAEAVSGGTFVRLAGTTA